MIGRARSVAARSGPGLCAVLALAVSGCDDSPPPEGRPTPQAAVVVWAMADFATNPGAAALLEWRSAEAAQTIVAAESTALPVNPRVAASRQMQETGPLPPAPLHVAQSASGLGAAALLAERARYD